VFSHTDGEVQIIGTVSAYAPNRATGDILPGLSIARDVSHFHNTIRTIKTMDEALAKKQEEERERAEKTLPAPATPPPETPAPVASRKISRSS